MADQLALWIPAAVVVIATIYNSGILSATVKFHGKKLEAHDIKLDKHSDEISKLVAWHDGFSAGTHRNG